MEKAKKRAKPTATEKAELVRKRDALRKAAALERERIRLLLHEARMKRPSAAFAAKMKRVERAKATVAAANDRRLARQMKILEGYRKKYEQKGEAEAKGGEHIGVQAGGNAAVGGPGESGDGAGAGVGDGAEKDAKNGVNPGEGNDPSIGAVGGGVATGNESVG